MRGKLHFIPHLTICSSPVQPEGGRSRSQSLGPPGVEILSHVVVITAEVAVVVIVVVGFVIVVEAAATSR